MSFSKKIETSKTIKQVKRLIGFSQFFHNYIPDLGTKLMPFYHLLKKDRELETTEGHQKNLATIKQDFLRATGITLRLPKPRQQHVILCNAGYHGTGFVLMVEDYVKENNSGEMKTYAPVSFGSRWLASPQFKFSVYYKAFLALYFALDHFPKYIWVTTIPVIILTDNRSLKQFFLAKSMPPPLKFSWQSYGVQYGNRIYSRKYKLCGELSFTKDYQESPQHLVFIPSEYKEAAKNTRMLKICCNKANFQKRRPRKSWKLPACLIIEHWYQDSAKKLNIALYNHFRSFLFKSQQVLISRRSVQTNMLLFIKRVCEAVDHDPHSEIIGFYFDFSKAFDKVTHYELLQKLIDMGAYGCLLEILIDYLKDWR